MRHKVNTSTPALPQSIVADAQAAADAEAIAPARASHTPGPWHRNIPPASHYPTIFAGRNTHVAHVSRVYTDGAIDEAQMEANLRLILEAPAMREALADFARIALDTIAAACDGKTTTLGYVEIAQQRAAAILARIAGEA